MEDQALWISQGKAAGSAPTFPTSAEAVNQGNKGAGARLPLLGAFPQTEVYAVTSSATNHHRAGGAGFVCERGSAKSQMTKGSAGVRWAFSVCNCRREARNTREELAKDKEKCES